MRISPNFIRKFSAYIFYLIMFYIIPIRKQVYFQNLQIAFPDKTTQWYKSLAKRGYKFFINQFILFFAFPKSFKNSEYEIISLDKLDNAYNMKKGVVFISGHFGAWELLSAWVTSHGYPVTAIAAKQKNRGSDKFFMEHRGQFGMKHVYRRSSIDEMYNILSKNEAIALVSDQDARKRGIFVDFFQKKASTPKGAALFYLNSGIPLIFTICCQTQPNKYVIEFIPIIPDENATIESITQAYTKILEDYIRKYPEQYFWFHRRWKTQPV